MEERFAALAGRLAGAGVPVAVLDVEATGGDFLRDRVIEVAYLRFENGRIRQAAHLVQPECAVPPFIAKLTGIDDDLLADAPVFADLAQALAADLRGCLLVAHNSRFDYTLLKQSFGQAGVAFATGALCTVQLSKVLFPNEKKHNLDALAARLGVAVPLSRHRAMTDVLVLAECLQQLAAVRPHWWETAQTLLNPPMLPQGLPADLRAQVADLPDGWAAVWWRGGGADSVRVCRHAYAETVAALAYGGVCPESVAAFPASGHVHALAEKGRLLYEHGVAAAPSAARRWAVVFETDGQGVCRARTVLRTNGLFAHPPCGSFANREAAAKALHNWARHQRLCPALLGIDGTAARTAESVGQEAVAQHNRAVWAAVPHFAAEPVWEIGETDAFSGFPYVSVCWRGAVQVADNVWYADAEVAEAVRDALKNRRHQVRERVRLSGAWHEALAALPKR
ncbi:3'-5' exonuclease [Conchiformibius kuhniae]|uniref:PolC-type DNA polymerase III n=1 Tax=Conchiformibius kuhniae TaxID=211502 RepID=A0A8T9MX96_9NEIS|nr:3'-5' exonuclease [Conchiformibius kuhniae]UOP05068.1 3'-5' exonuclease [Conchiformibius kuhniae]